MTHIPEYPVHGIRAIVRIIDQYAGERGDAWLEKPVDYHIKHAFDHMLAYLAGDDNEPHIEHCLTRLAMAKHVHEEARPPVLNGHTRTAVQAAHNRNVHDLAGLNV